MAWAAYTSKNVRTQRRSTGAGRVVPGHDREIARHHFHVTQGVLEQGLEQVLFVGEVEVEGAVRDAGPADHVVDPDAVETALLELDHARVEQPLDRGPALSAKLTVAGGHAAPVGGAAGPAQPAWSRRLLGGRRGRFSSVSRDPGPWLPSWVI